LLAGLEGLDVITQVADDLHDVFAESQPPSTRRYQPEPEAGKMTMNSEQASGGDAHRPAASGEEVCRGLRAQILGPDPASAGLAQGPEQHALSGALMETGHQRETATLVALADGATSPYLSAGGGITWRRVPGGRGHREPIPPRSAGAPLPMAQPDPDAALAGQSASSACP
jgi:hypothetical protein